MSALASERLRVAFVAGTLGQAGAEKQLVYAVGALLGMGADVRVYCATRGEYYEPALRALNVPPIWFGQAAAPPLRMLRLAAQVRRFRPHVIQSAHFFTNLYVGAVGRAGGAMAIGTIRNDTRFELQDLGHWGKIALRIAPVLIVNSEIAKRNAIAYGITPARIMVLPNAIDLGEFDALAASGAERLSSDGAPVVAAVARMAPEKRLDRFLEALALARQTVPALKGVLIGDGPEREHLEQYAAGLGLPPGSVQFLGRRDDVPALLRQVRALVVSSDHEGFPNVVLEAMAAGLPVVTTPAGEAATVVRDGITGYVVGFDAAALAGRVVRLVSEPDLGPRMGAAGRRIVEQQYQVAGLGNRLLACYVAIAERSGQHRLRRMLVSRYKGVGATLE